MDHPMRRKDRALSVEETFEVLGRCEVCRVALIAEPAPYVLPMNFGVERGEEETILYFHGANEGRKLSLMAEHPTVGFEADRPLALIRAKEACGWGMAFESVIGEGILELVEDADEKRLGLTAIMRQYSDEEFSFSDERVAHTCVLRLRITSISGKRRPLPEA